MNHYQLTYAQQTNKQTTQMADYIVFVSAATIIIAD